MKKQLLILIIVLQFFDTFCQNIEYKKLWIGSNRIYNYEDEGKMHAGKEGFLSSVLWFSENEINIIIFVIDYKNCTIFLDTLKYEYRIIGKKIVGNNNNDTSLIGSIKKNILKIKIGAKRNNVELTYLLPGKNLDIIKADTLEIKKLLLNGKWKTVVKGENIYEEFLPNRRYKLSTWQNEQKWDIFKIFDYNFLITNDCFDRPFISLLKKINSHETEFLVFTKEKINEYKKVKIK